MFFLILLLYLVLLIIFPFNALAGIRSAKNVQWIQTYGLSPAAEPPSPQVQDLPGAQGSQRHDLPCPAPGSSHFDLSKPLCAFQR